MERISAIICELNPLHDGHRYVFSKARESADVLIAVMSGNFVQRGECAVYNKYIRAKSALTAGADLVLELPFPFSASSAEFFAAAGITVAESARATDLYFGSECADLSALCTAARVLDNFADFGAGRAAAVREEALKSSGEALPSSVYSSPNDILATEYCRRAKIALHPVKRIDAASAGDVRRAIYSSRSDGSAVYPEALRAMEFHLFRSRRDENIYAEGGGGVSGRLYNAARSTNDSEQWLTLAATKQYTNARLRRAALFALCGVTDADLRRVPLYTAVLGANKCGCSYLRSISKCSGIEILTNPADKKRLDEEAMKQLEMRNFADSVYSLCANADDPACFAKASPIIL